MDIDEAIVKDILDREWEMFHSVQGMEGPAACQQDRRTFDIMRRSQLAAWNQEIAESWLDDLKRAEAAGRNLMTEKYARMMEYTSPCEYRRIGPSVPALKKDAEPIIERLSRMTLRWMEEVAEKYPHIGAQGRPLYSSDDNRYTPSFETYNRGELSTYSLRTLELLERHYEKLAAQGENPAEMILRATVAQYGYESLERAEAVQKARVEKARAGNARD